MKKALLSLICAGAMLGASAQAPFKIISPMPGIEEGAVAYLYNFDTSEKVDSVKVYEGAAVFTGQVDEPWVARIICNGNRMGTFILEQGTTAINQTSRRAVGSMLNDRLNAYNDSVEAIIAKYEEAKTDAEREKYLSQYSQYSVEAIEDNMDTALGYFIFIDYANMLDVDEMLAFIEQHPDLKSYVRVQKLISGAEKKLATSAGKKFVDFEVTYDGVTKKLSDYVGNGHYTLVDFWASWCGPCMREIDTLKEIYEKYNGKGLELLGVAVWDEPDNTLAAIKRKQIPWECMLNTQNVATDAYGIPAIPCIILFDPEGNIVFRDLQGNQLKEAVDDAMK